MYSANNTIFELWIFRLVLLLTFILQSGAINIGVLIPTDSQDSTNVIRRQVPQLLASNGINVQDHTLQYYQVESPTDALSKFCTVISQGGQVLIIPGDDHPDVRVVVPYANNWHIPVILLSANGYTNGGEVNGLFSIETGPPQTGIAPAIAAMVDRFDWKDVSVLFDQTATGINGVPSLQPLLNKNSVVQTSVYRVDGSDGLDALQAIQRSSSRTIIVWTSCENAQSLLKYALPLKMYTTGWAWVIAPLRSNCLDTLDKNRIDGLILLALTDGKKELDIEDGTTYASAILNIIRSLVSGNDNTLMNNRTSATCTTAMPYSEGQAILDKLKVHSDVTVEFRNLANDTWTKFAFWSKNSGYQRVFQSSSINTILFPGGARAVLGTVTSLKGRHLWACTIALNTTMSSWTNGGEPSEDGWEDSFDIGKLGGIAPGFFERVAAEIGFNYTYRYPRDKKLGVKLADGSWSGAFRELQEGRCEIVAAPISTSSGRITDFDLTLPFMQTGMTFMLAADERNCGLFCFLVPYTTDVWLCVVVAVIVAGIIIGLINKLSPYEYHGQFIFAPHDMRRAHRRRALTKQFRKAYKDETTQLSFSNAMWFSVTSLFQQASQQPLSFSGRLLALAWWFAVMAITALYVANLAALLTTAGLVDQIDTMEDLANQDKIKYGLVRSSAAEEYFLHSDKVLYQRMYRTMRRQPTQYSIGSKEEGFKRARARGFAMIDDTLILGSEAYSKPCTLRMASDIFWRQIQAWALPKGSPYTKQLNTIILQLKEQGLEEELMQEWFYSKTQCEEPDSSNGIKATNMADMLGVFFVIYFLMLVGAVTLLLEFYWSCYALTNSDDPKFKDIETTKDAAKYRLARVNRDLMLYYAPQRVRSKYRKLETPPDMKLKRENASNNMNDELNYKY